MRAILILLSMTASVVLISYGSVSAGAGSSPWQPEIKRLKAIENDLRSLHDQMNEALAVRPDPHDGPEGGFAAMETRLVRVSGLLHSAMDTILSIPAEQRVPEDLLNTLQGVRDSSWRIADSIDTYLSAPPHPLAPGLTDTLTRVGATAEQIALDAEEFMRASSEMVVKGAFTEFAKGFSRDPGLSQAFRNVYK